MNVKQDAESVLNFLSRIATGLSSQAQGNTQSDIAPSIYCIKKKCINFIRRDMLSAFSEREIFTDWFYVPDETLETVADEETSERLDRFLEDVGGMPGHWRKMEYEIVWRHTGQFYFSAESAQVAIGQDENLRIEVEPVKNNHELQEMLRLLSGPMLEYAKAFYSTGMNHEDDSHDSANPAARRDKPRP